MNLAVAMELRWTGMEGVKRSGGGVEILSHFRGLVASMDCGNFVE